MKPAMSLFFETSCISSCIILLAVLPLFLKVSRHYSKLAYLLGTGALSGILLFDLVPDLFKMGGFSSFWGVGIVWLIYSVLHLSHLVQHSPAETHTQDVMEPGVHHHAHSSGNTYIFLFSMIAHCMASGVLLVVSQGLEGGINRTVFWALLSHKAYEALTVTSVLIEKEKARRNTILCVLLYSFSLPAGVFLATSFRAVITPSVAMIVTSLAAGTLLGCLIFDFLLPSLAGIRNRKMDIAWIVGGLCLTQLVMKVFGAE
ncbi:MAG: ZIP family metal transporter [Bdellovibrionota bacterium]